MISTQRLHHPSTQIQIQTITLSYWNEYGFLIRVFSMQTKIYKTAQHRSYMSRCMLWHGVTSFRGFLCPWRRESNFDLCFLFQTLKSRSSLQQKSISCYEMNCLMVNIFNVFNECVVNTDYTLRSLFDYQNLCL